MTHITSRILIYLTAMPLVNMFNTSHSPSSVHPASRSSIYSPFSWPCLSFSVLHSRSATTIQPPTLLRTDTWRSFLTFFFLLTYLHNLSLAFNSSSYFESGKYIGCFSSCPKSLCCIIFQILLFPSLLCLCFSLSIAARMMSAKYYRIVHKTFPWFSTELNIKPMPNRLRSSYANNPLFH